MGAIHIDPFPGPPPLSITFLNSSSAVSQSLAASTASEAMQDPGKQARVLSLVDHIFRWCGRGFP